MADLRVHTKASRGIRNNNPFNIRKTAIKWQGKAAVSLDASFETFTTVEQGIRAGALDIRGDIRKGKNTVRTLINEFAPPHENNTDAYINFVSKIVGVTPDTILQDTPATIYKLAAAIIAHENKAVDRPLITSKMIFDGVNSSYPAAKKTPQTSEIGLKTIADLGLFAILFLFALIIFK
jgi:hypothetical protein